MSDKIEMIVDVYKFSHDIYGNPNALHTLFFYEPLNNFVVRQNRRVQVGYSDYLAHANWLINKYTPKGYKEIDKIVEGSRSSDCITVHVTLIKEQ